MELLMIEHMLPEFLTFLELKSKQVLEKRMEYQLQIHLRENDERDKKN